MHHSYTMICISEELIDSTKRIASLLKRNFIFGACNRLTEYITNIKYMTVIGLITDIELNTISDLMNKNVVFSIVAVKNKSDLLRYYCKISNQDKISLENVYIKDFLNGVSSISEEKLFHSNACFFQDMVTIYALIWQMQFCVVNHRKMKKSKERPLFALLRTSVTEKKDLKGIM